MVIAGFSQAGGAARASGQPSATLSQPADETREEAESPTYFRAISAISPGSLAFAYQAIRAQETAGVTPHAPGRPWADEPAVLSAQGLPGAFEAYREASEWE